MLQKTISAFLGAIALIPLSSAIHAETELELKLESGFSNNANKTNKADAIKERQDVVTARIKSSRINSTSSAIVDYSIEHENYSKDSQENETNLEGSASARFNLSPNLKVNLNHSAKRLINNPSETAISNNLQNRNIFSASVDAKSHITPLQVVTVTPSLAAIRYSDGNNQDSDRATLDMSWVWRLQEKSRIKINLQNSEIDYRSAANQSYQQLTLGYERENRLLTYSAEAGVNRFTTSSGSKNGPYFNLQATYDNQGQKFSINAIRQLTDTSFGNGNQNLTSSSNIDSAGTNIDQIEQDSFILSYSSRLLCGRCRFKAQTEFKDETHVNNPQESLNEKIIAASIRYFLNQRSNLSSSISFKATEYKQDDSRDFDEFSARLGYELSLSKASSLELFSEFETKDASQPINDYSELIFGLSFIYRL